MGCAVSFVNHPLGWRSKATGRSSFPSNRPATPRCPASRAKTSLPTCGGRQVPRNIRRRREPEDSNSAFLKYQLTNRFNKLEKGFRSNLPQWHSPEDTHNTRSKSLGHRKTSASTACHGGSIGPDDQPSDFGGVQPTNAVGGELHGFSSSSTVDSYSSAYDAIRARQSKFTCPPNKRGRLGGSGFCFPQDTGPQRRRCSDMHQRGTKTQTLPAIAIYRPPDDAEDFSPYFPKDGKVVRPHRSPSPWVHVPSEDEVSIFGYQYAPSSNRRHQHRRVSLPPMTYYHRESNARQ